ncbi:APC family permease [Chromobacterium alkanivorans]|uniref:APC family permease n=1 Tax=Chromobacterium alkanivorans TaxID=1071719 RepID=UPI001968845F|nr:APC family permease [Chromobacterium alkanivorans]MBN3004194.1 APC family permease [Chromobacterium alkanivorans]
MSTSKAGPGLRRSLSVTDVVLITVSGVTPASSIFVIAPFALQGAGSGAFLAFALAAALAVAFALCYAELGAAHPNAGGEYVIIDRVFGRALSLQMYLLILCLLLFIPAVLATGAAPYLNSALGTRLDGAEVALAMIVLCFGIAVLDIKLNAWLTGSFLLLELAALALIAWLGFSEARQPAAVLWQPVKAAADGGLAAVPAATIAAMVGTAVFAYNGFGGAVYFAEDMRESGRPVAKAVLAALAIVVLVELIPVTALILGAPSLAEMSRQADPINYVLSHLSRPALARVISGGIFLSVFNAIIAIVVQSGRFLYSSGRDGLWPAPASRALKRIHPRFGTPWVATLALAIPSALLTFHSSLDDLASFTVIILMLNYLLLALAALRSRLGRHPHPYRMPGWPWPPLLAAAGSLSLLWAVLRDAPARDWWIIGGIALAGALLAAQRPPGKILIVDEQKER